MYYYILYLKWFKCTVQELNKLREDKLAAEKARKTAEVGPNLRLILVRVREAELESDKREFRKVQQEMACLHR